MNRQRSVAVLVLLTFLVACASTPPDRIAYTSINAAVDGVQTALKAWNDVYYSPGVKVDPVKWNASRDQLNAAYVRFQASATLATTIAQDVTKQASAQQIINDAASQVLTLISVLEK